ncbi:unnamed protein product, partial [Closterium sp. NIES-53]
MDPPESSPGWRRAEEPEKRRKHGRRFLRQQPEEQRRCREEERAHCRPVLPYLRAEGQGGASAKVGAELHPLDYWVLDTGAAWTMTPRKELLDDVRAAPINEVCSASGHALKVAGAGQAAFKGADGKPVVLDNVILVPDLNANLISLRKLAKAGSRLVAKGFMQKEKQDFNEIFAPTAKPPSLREMGFRTSSSDESLFLNGEGEKLVLFLVYVDDILLFSSSTKEIQKVQQQLMKNFKCKTLGEVKYYLGMHVERGLDHRWLKLHQEKFIKELGEKYGIENGRRVATPLPAEFKLVKQKWVEVLKEKGERLGEGKLFLTCFTDATWASEKDDSSSVGRYICVVGGGPVSWRSKKQTETALSSVELEYMTMFNGVKEVIWLRRLLEEIREEQKVATPLFCDSKGALGMARNA